MRDSSCHLLRTGDIDFIHTRLAASKGDLPRLATPTYRILARTTQPIVKMAAVVTSSMAARVVAGSAASGSRARGAANLKAVKMGKATKRGALVVSAVRICNLPFDRRRPALRGRCSRNRHRTENAYSFRRYAWVVNDPVRCSRVCC